MFCAIANGPTLVVTLFGLMVSGSDGPGSSPPSLDDSAYRAAAEAAGRDAEAQLGLALWCEANGLESEARHHLALAVLIDPDHAAARALMGRVRLGESWLRPGDVPSRVPIDPDRAALREDYEGRRARISPTKADDHWKLALWCEKNGLVDEATAHISAVTRLDPKREAAWKRLGFIKNDGRWLSPSQLKAEEAETAARSVVEAEWKPRIEQWAEQLGDPARRAEAMAGLSTVEDPLLARLVWEALIARPNPDLPIGIQVLGQIDSKEASRALSQIAMMTDDAEVRRRAIETLRRRDPRDWAGPLIGMLREVVRYEVRPVGGPGSPGVLYIEGEEFDTRRFYEVQSAGNWRAPMPGEIAGFAPNGAALAYTPRIAFGQPAADVGDLASQLRANPGQAASILQAAASEGAVNPGPSGALFATGAIPIAGDPFGGWAVGADVRPTLDPALREYFRILRGALTAQQRLEADVSMIEANNQQIIMTNQRVLPVLQQGTGVESGLDRKGWQDWYLNDIGLRAYRNRLPETAQRRVVNQRLNFVPNVTSSCFAAGTPVWTERGSVAIEELQVGDLVLSQDTRSGSLAYRPITAAHHNPPSKTFMIRLGDDSIVSSEFHRFWIAGRGWVMARDLKVGDLIRALGRTAEVEAIDEGQVQPVYNLDVADSRSFFVGKMGVLVHDHSLPETNPTPFDAVPDLAEMARVAGSEPEADPGD